MSEELESKLSLELPGRSSKPRIVGLSNIVDNGSGLAQLEDFLSLSHQYIDIIKLGWASALITPVYEKVQLFNRYDIHTCPGGVMFELCYWQNKIDDYAVWLKDHDINIVEVSNGSLPIPESDKRRMIEYFANRDFIVLSEVGNKDITIQSSPDQWVECIKADRDAGAYKIILEGRADASAGIYDANGIIQEDIIQAVIESDINVDDLIFEAPHKKQIIWFIKKIGCNVNLGNIPLTEVINLETLRLGLRGDTVQHFHLTRNL